MMTSEEIALLDTQMMVQGDARKYRTFFFAAKSMMKTGENAEYVRNTRVEDMRDARLASMVTQLSVTITNAECAGPDNPGTQAMYETPDCESCGATYVPNARYCVECGVQRV